VPEEEDSAFRREPAALRRPRLRKRRAAALAFTLRRGERQYESSAGRWQMRAVDAMRGF